MNKPKSLTAATFALFFLAACSSGGGGLGDIFGGGSAPSTNNYEIRGTVSSVDINNRSVYLTNVTGYTSMLSNGGSSVRVYFDDQTRVEYQGQTYRPQDLERGDEVAVRVDESGNALMAERVTVLHDVTGGTSSNQGSGVYNSTMTGVVRNIDTSRRVVELDRGYGSTILVDYSTNTPVYFNNQTYRVGDLERGDEISIRVNDLGGGRYSAQDITVTRNVSGTSSGSMGSSQYSTVRGTVRSVNTSTRTIELESANYVSGFNTGATSGNRVYVNYGTNAAVEISGRGYPVTGLERGDVIEVQVSRDGNALWAQRIMLVSDVNNRY